MATNQPMTEAQEEVLGDVADVLKYARDAADALETAECVETGADLIANLESALSDAAELQKELKTLLARAKRGAKKKTSDDGDESEEG